MNLPSGPSNVTSGWMLDSFRSSFLTFAESYETKKNLYNTVHNKLIYSIPVVVIVLITTIIVLDMLSSKIE